VVVPGASPLAIAGGGEEVVLHVFKDRSRIVILPKCESGDASSAGRLPSCDTIDQNKSREYVCFISKSTNVNLQVVMTPADDLKAFCIAKFSDGTLVVVAKTDRTHRFSLNAPGGPWQMHAVLEGKFTMERLKDLLLHLVSRSATWYGNLIVETFELQDDSACSFEGLCSYFKGWNPSDFRGFCANAKWAKTEKRATRHQLAACAQHAELSDWVRSTYAANMMIRISDSSEKPDIHTGFFRDDLLDLPVTKVNHQTRMLEEITLNDWYNTTLHRHLSLVVVGRSRTGKSLLLDALGRSFSRRRGVREYVHVTGNLDPLGLLTKDGTMAAVHFFAFSDVQLTVLMNSHLEREESKQLFNVEEAFGCRARYHAILIPPHRPRGFSWNITKTADGSIDWGGILRRHLLCPVAAVACKSQQDIFDLDEDGFAQAARVCVLCVDDSLIKDAGSGVVDSLEMDGLDSLEEELKREREFIENAI